MQQRHDAEQACAAQAALARLTPSDIATLQSRLPVLREFIGQRRAFTRLTADRAHDLALGLAKVTAPGLASITRPDPSREHLETVVDDLLGRFPANAVRVVLVVLWEESRIDTPMLERMVDRTHERADDGTTPPGSDASGHARSPLNTLVAQVVRVAAADRDDAITQVAVGEAVDELLALDRRRPGSWYLAGLADGHGIGQSVHEPQSHEARRRYVAGRIDAAVERRSDGELVEIVVRWESDVRDLVAGGDLVHAAARVSTALLDVDPVSAARIATAAAAPFAHWKSFLSIAAEWVETLREEGRSGEADAVADAIGELRARWKPPPR